jgi:hypothetical protein
MASTTMGASVATMLATVRNVASLVSGIFNPCVSIQMITTVTVAKNPVAAASTPQPSVPQKPHGASAAGCATGSGCELLCGRPMVSIVMDKAAHPR